MVRCHVVYRKLIIIFVIVIAAVPIAYAIFTPSGEFITIGIEPAKNNTLGGMFAQECPTGELPYAIFENGTFACKVP